ncbi:MAG: prephenate dehydrogenase/arogenate dehydrogenase family protein [Fidelibacterota bacterium]
MLQNKTSTVGIIGLGRFGKVLADILSDDFSILAYDPNVSDEIYGVTWASLEDVCRQEAVFIAVPIRRFKEVIREITPYVRPGTTVLDVCSVKVYPVTVMKEHLSADVGIIGTHPLFGPDSIHHPTGHTMVMTNVRAARKSFQFWWNYFAGKSITVLELSPEVHDRQAARTQGITHFIGRVIREAGIEATNMDTLGFKDLMDVVDQTCNDSWELFMDLQNYNPYTLTVIDNLEKSIASVRQKIIQRD